MLIFRVFQTAPKMTVKIVHATFHAASVIFICLGLGVEFITHGYHSEANLYSLHSWIGIGTVVIFVSQFFFGVCCYLSPWMKESMKAFYHPMHVFFGIVCFIMAIATSLIGLNQNARFNMQYTELPSQGVLINIIGVLITIYGVLVVFLVTQTRFKRLQPPTKTESIAE